MQHMLLRDGERVADDWQVGEAGIADGTGLIVPFDRWREERDRWLAHQGRLGVLLSPTHLVEQLAPDLARLALVAVEFPSASDGRGYSQGRLLRERWAFAGELRAMGYVRQDQLFFLARCGFNAFELPESEFDAASRALATFSVAYQNCNDAGLGRPLRHRQQT